MSGKAATKSETSGTKTVTSSSRSDAGSAALDAALTAKMEKSLRLQLVRSLTRIERHLSHRDPQALRRISEWYSTRAAAARRTEGAGDKSPTPSPVEARPARCLPFDYRQKRMEQNEIDNDMLGRWENSTSPNATAAEYLKIPNGVATRSLLVPPQPAWVFSDAPPPLPNPGAVLAGFRWLPLNSNVSNAEDSSRRSMEREMMRQRLDHWVFLFFRVLRRNWESTVVEEKKSVSDVNMYAEEHIYKWTVKLRFKIMRQVPVKVALSAFLSRLGLESNATIVFCRDGFYGMMDVGNAYGDITKTPCAMIGFNSTPRYLGLKNGDSIFVNSCSVSQRQMMEEAPRHDLPKKHHRMSRLSVDGSEEGEYDFDGYTDDDDQQGDLDEFL